MAAHSQERCSRSTLPALSASGLSLRSHALSPGLTSLGRAARATGGARQQVVPFASRRPSPEQRDEPPRGERSCMNYLTLPQLANDTAAGGPW